MKIYEMISKISVNLLEIKPIFYKIIHFIIRVNFSLSKKPKIKHVQVTFYFRI